MVVSHPWKFATGLLALATTGFILVGCESKPAQPVAGKFVPVEEEETSTRQTSPATSINEKPSPELPPLKNTNPPATNNLGKTKAASNVGAPEGFGEEGSKAQTLRSLSASLRSQPRTREDLQRLQTRIGQILAVSAEILADEGVSAEERDEALFARFQAAALMQNYDLDKDAAQMLLEAAESLSHASDPKLATMGRVQLLDNHVNEVLALKPRDAKEVLTALQTLLDAGGEAEVLALLTIQITQKMEAAGYPKDANAGLDLIAAYFEKSTDEKTKMAANQVKLLALLGRIRMGENVEQAGKDLVALADSLVKSSEGDPSVFQMLQGLAREFEGEQPEIAGPLYDLISANYSQHPDERVARMAKESVEGAKKRLALLGQPFEVTGSLVNGKPFDWKKYEGKIVLIDFWATWCQPCLEEMSNISQNYKEFHDRGFEVVGINLDDDIPTVEKFFEIRTLPWTTVVASDDDHRGFDHPMAVKCGVDAIPFVVLVGRDGKVAGIHVRGPRLEATLKEMLGDEAKPEETPEESLPEDPQAEAATPEEETQSEEAK